MRSPTIHDSHWRPVRLLLQSIDGQISALYDERGIAGVPPRYSMVLITLGAGGGRTIKDLAADTEVTHSAMSQTVAAMRRDALVRTVPGGDARTRLVTLTDHGRELVPFLETEWWATEAVLEQIDAETGGGLRVAAEQVAKALATRSFAERVREHLDSATHLVGYAGGHTEPTDGGRGHLSGDSGPGSGGRDPVGDTGSGQAVRAGGGGHQ